MRSKKVENGWPAHVVRIVKDEKCVDNCNRKPRIEISLRRLSLDGMINTEIDVTELRCEYVNWIGLNEKSCD
jgi:hypothetical protein